MVTIFIGVHILLVAIARSAVQNAADAAVAAAQAAPEADREAEGIFAARLAMAATDNSAALTRDPVVVVEEDKGIVSALVYGGTISPLLGGMELTVLACAPLDTVDPSRLTADDDEVWRC